MCIRDSPVVSLPSATPSKKLWEKCTEWLNSFEKIILSVDNDEAGNAVADRMAKLFPNKVYRDTRPSKDLSLVSSKCHAAKGMLCCNMLYSR